MSAPTFGPPNGAGRTSAPAWSGWWPARLGRALVRPTAGELVELPFARGRGPQAAARRAAPGTIVVAVDAERGVLVAHRLTVPDAREAA